MWQPIETAPKDGTTVILGVLGKDDATTAGWWEGHYWMIPDGHPWRSFTHWMPLPPPPAA